MTKKYNDIRNGFWRYLCSAFLALFFLGAMFFLSYRFFIITLVQDSEEYRAAVHYVRNSPSLKEQLVAGLKNVVYDGIRVNEKAGYGIGEINFTLELQNKLSQKLKIGLVKMSDYWIVYQAILNPQLPGAVVLVSTHQKILWLQERVDLNDPEAAKYFIDELKIELADQSLIAYLEALVADAAGEYADASEKLDGLMLDAHYARPAILYQKGMVVLSQKKYDDAIKVFQLVLAEAAQFGEQASLVLRGDLFANLPKDPFLASLNPKNIAAAAMKNLALSYTYSKKYPEGLQWAERALNEAIKIKSSVTRLNALYVKGLSLFYLKRYDESDRAFSLVATDLENANLGQRAMAYYYKGYIAAVNQKYEDSLDYYEIAISLDPSNPTIRKDVITYLTMRNFVGDWEIALGMAIRGVDYGIEEVTFKQLAASLYQKMGLSDRTIEMVP